ncbi:MAG: hypothetical protein CVV27_08490 [Candidatus Melainabacteria bacterium HGW-Melainabacteria-1]|nr:MAG: hypothetical protein CVV27_08490 [Candidatus Melainabacteria bacterium HGW-Melainabacteria-1]
MTTHYKKSRILGLAFLIQFVTSFSAGVFILPKATGVKAFGAALEIGQIMANVAKNVAFARLNIFIELITAAGVIFLGAMLYSAVRKQHRGLALTAFGLYVMEGVLIAVTKLALYALMVLSQEYVAAGNPVSMEAMAGLAYKLMEFLPKINSVLYCIGGTIFYALLFKTRTVARPLSLWGLLSFQGVFAAGILSLFGAKAPVFLYVPYIPFELFIAIWILVKGINKEIEDK